MSVKPRSCARPLSSCASSSYARASAEKWGPSATLNVVTQTRSEALPERAELLPGVWRLPLPLRDSPLGHVNTYLVRSDDGYLLVDCGWDTVDTLQALQGHLRALDIAIGDV